MMGIGVTSKIFCSDETAVNRVAYGREFFTQRM